MTTYNFGAGPAMLPSEVLQKAQAELLDWRGTGMSVMEVSHRSKDFIDLYEQAVANVRELLDVPGNYQILFLQGGASSQFSMVPINLLRGKDKAAYVQTGEWSKKAIQEGRRYCDVQVAASSEDVNYTYAPKDWQVDPGAAYIHYTANETIQGVEFHSLPATGEIPLAADMSSNLFSRPVDVRRHGVIYAGAQKNIGPSGVTLVIVREDLIGEVVPKQPKLFDYKVMAESQSMYNTPPTFAIYIANLVFEWLKQRGGLEAMAETNRRKADFLYDYIDQSGFYFNPVRPGDRSFMNVPFILKDTSLDAEFLKQADARGLMQLKGHRSVGGMRASIYNAMPLEGIEALVWFMREFAHAHA